MSSVDIAQMNLNRRILRKTLLIALVLAAALAGTVNALEIPGARALADLIMRFDSNGNSTIDTREWQDGVAGSFDDIDGDRDGKITAVEIDDLSGPLEQEAGTVAATLVPKLLSPLIMSMDANKDGAVSRDEFIKKVDEMFARLDANKDAILTRTELIDLPVRMVTAARN